MKKLNTSETEPYTLYATDNSINIRWFTDTPCIGNVSVNEIGSDKELIVEEKTSSRFHNIHLDNLKPFTEYEYCVYPNGKMYSFHTLAPAECTSFKFVVFGDPQGHDFLKDTMAIAADFNPHFSIGLGDFIWHATSESYSKFINISRTLLDKSVLFPLPGNHDYKRCSAPFDHDNDTAVYDLFLGNGKANNYTFDCGKLRFIMLNYPDRQTFPLESQQGNWLRQELLTARQRHRKVVLAHHCACFTSTTITWAVDDTLIPPLAEEFSDILLLDIGGHIHTYERSMYPDDNGTCFITSGGAGELYPKYPVNQTENPFQQCAYDSCHVCLFEVKDDQITIKAIDIDGKCIDKTILKIEPTEVNE